MLGLPRSSSAEVSAALSIKTKIKNRHAGTDGEREQQASLLPHALVIQHPSRFLFFSLLSLPKHSLQMIES